MLLLQPRIESMFFLKPSELCTVGLKTHLESQIIDLSTVPGGTKCSVLWQTHVA